MSTRLGEKAHQGRWRTLKDGRHVPIGKPAGTISMRGKYGAAQREIVNNLQPDDILELHHGTRQLEDVERILTEGFDPTQVPKGGRVYAGTLAPEKGFFVSPYDDVAQRFGGYVIEFTAPAKTLVAPPSKGMPGDETPDEFWQSSFPKSFRPSLSESLTWGESQGLLTKKVGVESIWGVRTYDREKREWVFTSADDFMQGIEKWRRREWGDEEYERRWGSKAIGRWRTLKDGRPILVTSAPSVSAMRSGVARYLGVQPKGKVEVLPAQDFDDRFGSGSDLHGGVAAITTAEGTYLKEGLESDAVHEMIHRAGFMPSGVGEFLNEGMTQAAAQRAGEDMGIPVRETYGKETRFVEKYVLPSVGVGEREFFHGYAKAQDKGKYVADLVWKAHGDRFSNVEDWGRDPRERMHRSLATTLGTSPYLSYLVDELGVGSKATAQGEVATGFAQKARGRGGTYGRWRTLKDGRRVFVSGGLPSRGSGKSGMLMRRAGRDVGVLAKGDIDPDKVDKLLHDFESMPTWATKGISLIELHEEPGERFKAGGEEFQTGMDYTDHLGRIRVFQANKELSAYFGNDGFSHEVGHSIEHRWRTAALDQQDAAMREHPDWFGKTGRLGKAHEADYESTYPLAGARRRWLMAWSNGEDGVTPYSRAWAKEGAAGETFAEMAKFYFGSFRGRGRYSHARGAVLGLGDEKGAPNLAQAFVDVMDALSKGAGR